MKNIYFILILFFISILNFSQDFNSPHAREFLISEENNPSTFEQANPKLFTDGDGFIVTWTDYRLGTATRFAQKFDPLGNKMGNNLLIYYDDSVILKNDSVYSLGGRISSFDKDNNLLNSFDVERSSGSGWCGTGWLGEDYQFWKSKNGFAYFFNSGGKVSSFKFDEQGNKINTWDDSLGFDDTFTFTELKVSGMKDGSHILAVHKLVYLNDPAPDSEEPTADVYVSFFDSEDSLLAPDVRLNLTNEEESDLYSSPELSRIKVIPLNNEVYQVFYLRTEPLSLVSQKIDKRGSLAGNKDSIFISDEYYYYYNFSISNLTGSGFDVLISLHDYPDNYDSYIFNFDNLGNLKDSLHTKKEFYAIQENIQKIDSVNYFAAASDEKDVFLNKFNGFEKVDSLKINDDKVGSNEFSASLKNKNGNYEAFYNKEDGYYSREFNGKGVLLSDEKPAEKINGYFANGNAIELNSYSSYKTNEYGIFYSIYNPESEIIFSDTLRKTENYVGISYIFKDDYILLILKDDPKSYLYRINSFGEVEKEREIDAGHYSRFFTAENETFWLKTQNQIQLIDKNLEPISEWIENDNKLDVYLGDERFLSLIQNSQYLWSWWIYYNYAMVCTVKGDTLVKPIEFGNGAEDIYANRLNRDEFILTYKESRYNMISVIYDKFGNYKNKFRVNTETGKSIENPSVIVDDDKLIYVWSDIKEEEKGYNVYGKIYDVSEVTSVKTPVE